MSYLIAFKYVKTYVQDFLGVMDVDQGTICMLEESKKLADLFNILYWFKEDVIERLAVKIGNNAIWLAKSIVINTW